MAPCCREEAKASKSGVWSFRRAGRSQFSGHRKTSRFEAHMLKAPIQSCQVVLSICPGSTTLAAEPPASRLSRQRCTNNCTELRAWRIREVCMQVPISGSIRSCLLYTSDAADEEDS